MALDFPTSPNPGEEYGNYYWDATLEVWRAKPLDSAVAATGTVPPEDPKPGDLWYNTIDGTLFVYYYDSNTYQWVEVKANSTLGTTVADRVTAIENTRPNVNYIINGGMDIWQRGTSFASASYTADRWYTGTGNWARSTDVPANTGITYSLANSVSQTNWTIQQAIELPIQGSANGFNNGVYTLSFYAKIDSGKTFAVAAWYADGVAGGNQASAMLYNPNLVGTGAWQRYTVTENLTNYTANATNKAFRIGVFNLASIAFTTVAVTGFQLEAGAVATPFHRNANSIQGELAACQRYYYRADRTNLGEAIPILGSYYSSTTCYLVAKLPQQMRAFPTFASSAQNNIYLYSANAQRIATSISSPGVSSFNYQMIGVTTAAATAGYIAHMDLNTGWLEWSAEL